MTGFLAAFFQDLARLTQFFQSGNHRKHHLHVADRAGSNNRAQLRLKDVHVLEAKTKGAPAEKRIQFVAHVRRANRELIATEIERANDQRIRMHPFGDLSVNLILLLFGRKGVTINVEKLRPIKSDSLRAVVRDSVNITW